METDGRLQIAGKWIFIDPLDSIDSLKAIDPDWALDGVRELGKSYERTREHIKAGIESILESIEKYLNTSISNLSLAEKCTVE